MALQSPYNLVREVCLKVKIIPVNLGSYSFCQSESELSLPILSAHRQITPRPARAEGAAGVHGGYGANFAVRELKSLQICLGGSSKSKKCDNLSRFGGKQLTFIVRVSFSNFIFGKCQNTPGRYIFYFV